MNRIKSELLWGFGDFAMPSTFIENVYYQRIQLLMLPLASNPPKKWSICTFRKDFFLVLYHSVEIDFELPQCITHQNPRSELFHPSESCLYQITFFCFGGCQSFFLTASYLLLSRGSISDSCWGHFCFSFSFFTSKDQKDIKNRLKKQQENNTSRWSTLSQLAHLNINKLYLTKRQ